jgi:hypothetical protein
LGTERDRGEECDQPLHCCQFTVWRHFERMKW